MQEAYVKGYWEQIVSFMRSLFNSTFKTNPYLERGLMTGITRVSKESIFSDLNHLEVVTTSSDKYATSFGFTEEEEVKYQLALTNHEVTRMFQSMVRSWFLEVEAEYGDFITALLQGDVEAMNEYMNRITLEMFSYFDAGKNR